MKVVQALLLKRVSALFVVVTGLLLTGLSGRAQGVQHLSIIQPGGMPGMPVLTGIQQTTNGFKLTWDGPSGYYQVWHKVHLTDPSWLAVGGDTNLIRTATITTLYSNDFFRVLGPSPQYGGAMNCAFCHGTIYITQTNTPHAQAFAGLQQIHQDTNLTCLPCHTVGYGLPTGFMNAAQTPQLAGVQCESCHGPAGNHAANPAFTPWVPQVELAAQVCGGCHSAQLAPEEVVAHNPMAFAFEDWSASPHGAVVPDVLQSMAASTNNINSCGRCHSGSARLALLDGENPSVTDTNDYNVAITCAVCHDPHTTYVWTNVLSGVVTNPLDGFVITNDELGAVYTNQLRNPLYSTNDYSLSTSDVFTNSYNPNINICAQCHNARGAAWTDTSHPPHESDQYNMLLGTIGVLGTNLTPYQPSTHALMEEQCVYCHMQTAPPQSGPPAVAAISGHSFTVTSYQACTQCHGPYTNVIAILVSTTQSDILSNQNGTGIEQVKALLDMWATNAAPAELRTNYGTLAWEYTTPGDLSATTNSGPSTADQALIPDDIKKARFDLYLVYYDGSYGVHNGLYAFALLQSAQSFVTNQLSQ